MTSVKEATPEMFEEVYQLLLEFNRNNPQITRSHWELLFKQPWKKPEDTLGYVLFDDEKVVGYLGAICSHRLIDGKMEKFCNLTSWVVNKEHRQKGISLFMPVLKLKDYTITIHTPAKHVHEFYKRMGFQELERKQKILYPFPQVKSLFSGFRGTTDKNRIEKILRGNDAQIFHDHRQSHCSHLVIHKGDRYCYVIFSKTKGRKVYFTDIHYVSHPEIFVNNLNVIRFHFLKVNHTLFTLLQSRLVKDAHIPRAKESFYGAPPLYKSSHLKPEQIDNLYSELMLLPL